MESNWKIKPNSTGGVLPENQEQVIFHKHTGIESARISYNDLTDLPGDGEDVVANPKSITLDSAETQYLLISDANQTGLALTGDFTFEAWVKLSSLADTMAVLSKANSTTDSSYAFRIMSTGKIRILASGDGTTSSDYLEYETSEQQIFVGVWTHIAARLDISEEEFVIYVNGQSVPVTDISASSLGATLFDSAAPFIIGGRLSSGVPTDLFDGKIDDVRVWNDIRTPTEIEDNYQIELEGNEAGLVGYWKLDGDADDLTSNNNDLSDANDPTYSDDFWGA